MDPSSYEDNGDDSDTSGDNAGTGDNSGTGDNAGAGDNSGTGDNAGAGDNAGTGDGSDPAADPNAISEDYLIGSNGNDFIVSVREKAKMMLTTTQMTAMNIKNTQTSVLLIRQTIQQMYIQMILSLRHQNRYMLM